MSGRLLFSLIAMIPVRTYSLSIFSAMLVIIGVFTRWLFKMLLSVLIGNYQDLKMVISLGFCWYIGGAPPESRLLDLLLLLLVVVDQ